MICQGSRFVAGLAITPLLLCLTFSACSRSSPQPQPSFPKPVTGDPNLDYWIFFNDQFHVLQMSSSKKGGASAFDTQIAAERMSRVSTQGVDPQLVAWSLRVVRWNSEYSVQLFVMKAIENELAVAASQPNRNSPPPAGSWLWSEMGEALIADRDAIREDGLRLQQVLTERYGKQFPTCDF